MRAEKVIADVESTAKALQAPNVKKEEKPDDGMISFEDCINEQVIEQLRSVDLNTLSPYEAMSFLFDLKKRLQ